MWSSRLCRPLPMPGEVHFWCLFPEEVQGASLLKVYETLLSPDERAFVHHASTDTIRKQRLLARVLVRTTLARYTNGLADPTSLTFIKNKFGKPEVAWSVQKQQNAPSLCFNISHTSSLLACGVSIASNIGIDVETKERKLSKGSMKLAKRRFSPDEVSWLQEFNDSDEQQKKFLQLWTLKEAYVKATGRGISGESLKCFSLHLMESKTIHLSFKKVTDLPIHPHAQAISFSKMDVPCLNCWRFFLFEPSPTHYASICTQNDKNECSFRLWKTIPLCSEEMLEEGAVALGLTE